MEPDDKKEDAPASNEAIQKSLETYSEEVMSKVPFGGLGVATESFDKPFLDKLIGKND